jgi:methionine-rich copper-binding protein CopC
MAATKAIVVTASAIVVPLSPSTGTTVTRNPPTDMNAVSNPNALILSFSGVLEAMYVFIAVSWNGYRGSSQRIISAIPLLLMNAQ